MAKPAFDPNKPFSAVKPPFDPSKPFEVKEEPAEPTGPGLPEQFETAARSYLEGVTLGVSEPVISGINAGVANLIDAGFSSNDIASFVKQAADVESLKKAYTSDVERRKRLESELPGVALSSELAGGVLSGLASGGATTAAKALTAPTRAVTALSQMAAKKVPTAIGKGIAGGAVAAGAAEALKGAVEVPTGIAGPEEFDVGRAAMFGGKIGGTIPAAIGAAKAAKTGASKVLSALGGVQEDVIKQYLKNPEAVAQAKSIEEVKDRLDNFVGQLFDDVEKGKVAISEADEALAKAKNALNEAKKQNASDFQWQKFNANAELDKAQARLREAKVIAKADTEAAMNAQKLSLRDQALTAIENLKEKVKAASAESYKILEKSGRVISVKPAIDAGEAALESLKIQGKPPTTGASAAAYRQIQGYVDDLKRYKNILSTKDAKKKIQQLDQDWQAAISAGEFTDSAQQALRSIRKAFDQQLKDIPEYRKIMDEVSSNADLLSRSNKAFGTLEKAQTRIARIDAQDRDLERALLVELGDAVGRPFGQAIGEIQGISQKLQPAAIEAQLAASPVGREAAAAEIAAQKFALPGAKEAAIAPVMQGPLAAAVTAAEQRVLEQKRLLDAVQQKLKDIGPFARAQTNISAIRSALSEKNPEYLSQLKMVSEMSGEDFVKYVDDLRLAEAFGKEFRIGSRNVNVWALGLGGAAYGMTGDLTSSLVLAGLGGGFGSLIDRFGPKMTQKVLDAYLKIEGIPTLQKMNKAFASLPPEIATAAKRDFVRSVAVARREDIEISPAERESYINEIKANDFLSPMQKAHSTMRIYKDGVLDSVIAQKIMLGGTPASIEENRARAYNAIRAGNKQ